MVKETINKFRGSNYFLSNFYNAPVKYLGMTYRNNEAAFQSAKVLGTKQANQRIVFTHLEPSEAKHKGRHVTLRADWEQVKDQVMYDIVKAKFSDNTNLKQKLLDTGTAELIEGNTWGDTYWGYDIKQKRGRNELGKTLMRVRNELK